MVARVFHRSKSFRAICRYLCKDEARAEVLYQEGVRGHDYRLMAQDFETIHAQHAGRQKMVFHAVLDFHPSERIDDAKRIEIAQKYLEGVEMTNTQYALVKHRDKSHLHVHIVANRIDKDGIYIDNYPEVLKSNDANRKLVQEYGLKLPGKKD